MRRFGCVAALVVLLCGVGTVLRDGTARAEERPAAPSPAPVQPAPAQAAPKVEAAPAPVTGAEGEHSAPFAPSETMRVRARQAARLAGTTVGGTTTLMPEIRGVVVIGEEVLACFKVGEALVLVKPGDRFEGEWASYQFVRYANGVATLQGPEGKNYEIRMGTR